MYAVTNLRWSSNGSNSFHFHTKTDIINVSCLFISAYIFIIAIFELQHKAKPRKTLYAIFSIIYIIFPIYHSIPIYIHM